MLVYNARFDILGLRFNDLVLVDGSTVFMVFTNDWMKVGNL